MNLILDLDYLNRIYAKGRQYWYYRRDGRNIPIGLGPDQAGFRERYDAIHVQFEAGSESSGKKPGSLGALIVLYKSTSPEYAAAKLSTKRAYDTYLEYLDKHHGTLMVAHMPRSFVFKLRDKFQATPRKANYQIQVLRLVLSFGVDRGWRTDNPASRPKLLKSKTDGHRPFEENEIQAFREKWAIGTLERTAFELLINTGQRIGDIVLMSRAHLVNGEIAVTQEKTKARVWIPVSNDLAGALTPYLVSHNQAVMLVTRKAKTPTGWTVSGLQHLMRDAYRDAGLPDDVTNHGARYTAATRLHELGCDWETIAAITGHETMQMVRKYTAKRRKGQLAIARLNRSHAQKETGSGT